VFALKKEEFILTPWEVKGKIDYDKLIEKFGTSRIDEALLSKIKGITGDLHLFFRRGLAFSHRDFDIVINEYLKGNGFFLYTGRGPSGKMHIGHILPFHFTKWLQDKFNVNLYIQITDDEKYYLKDKEIDEIKKIAYDNMLDIAAVGFNPDKTFIFMDSEYIKNMYKLVMKVAKKINFSTVKAIFGFNNETNIGMIHFPSIEIVPTMFEKAPCLIPAAIDQDPYWRAQRDIAESLGYYKAAAVHLKMLPPLTGVEGKMSSSDPNSAILLDDDEDTVKRKVMRYAFSGGQATVELQRKLGGNPDIDVSFQWLAYFLEENDERLEEIRHAYKSGKLLTGELKEITAEKLAKFLEEHRKKKENAKKDLEKMMYSGRLAKKMWETTY
jgi:tryptophanyl-tRNA synthetase